MCSNRWANPVRPAASLAGPTWYQRLTAVIGSPRFGLRMTSSPLGNEYFSTWMRGISTGLDCADIVITPADAISAISRGRRERRLFIMVITLSRSEAWPARTLATLRILRRTRDARLPRCRGRPDLGRPAARRRGRSAAARLDSDIAPRDLRVRGVVETGPEIPTRDGTIRPPGLADLHQ